MSKNIPESPTQSDPLNNRLLAALPRDEYERLLPRLEVVRLAKNRILNEAGDMIQHAYFPLSGMASLLAITDEGSTIEIGSVGTEGFIGVPIIHRGETTPYRVAVQMQMTAMKMKANFLLVESKRDGPLTERLLQYAHVQETQLAMAAPCALFHSVEQRFARRLLVMNDCLESNTFRLTLEQLGIILDRHRNRISAAIRTLKSKGLIDNERGRITIVNLKGLEAAACECYRVLKESIANSLML